MHIAHLARAENELLASLLEDELRFVLREDMRGAVVFLRQLLLPLHHFAGEANDHVVLIGLSVNRDGAECGAFDLHGLTLFLIVARGSDSASADELRSDAIRPNALAPHRSPDPNGSTPFPSRTRLYHWEGKRKSDSTPATASSVRFRRLGFPRTWLRLRYRIHLYSDFRKINSLCLSSLDSLSKASFASFA